MYRVYRNQAATSYLSLISLFFFLSNVQKLKNFVTLSSGTMRPAWYTCQQWVDVSCIPESGCCPLFVPLFLHFSFSPIVKHWHFLSHFSQELWGLESWNLVHFGACIMYTGIRLLLLVCPFIGPFFFLSYFQLQICLSPLIAL